jgi:hypothetical protein
MKTLILTTALVAAATFSFGQKEASESNKEVKQSGIEVALLQHADDEVTLLMEKEPRKLVTIKVYEDNKLLYMQRVRKEATANITYDISEFPAGDYVFEVVKDKEVVYSAKVHKGSTELAENK